MAIPKCGTLVSLVTKEILEARSAVALREAQLRAARLPLARAEGCSGQERGRRLISDGQDLIREGEGVIEDAGGMP